MSDGFTRYDTMPIPPVESQTRYFDAGAVSFGVEYRLLDDAIAAAGSAQRAAGVDSAAGDFADRGVSLHVFGMIDGERIEFLRFDCFDEDPHYHYVSWSDRSNHMHHIDPVSQGDPLAWALERLRSRLPQMLERAGAGDLLRDVDPAQIEQVLPKVAEAAYRVRFRHDDDEIRRAALAEDAR